VFCIIFAVFLYFQWILSFLEMACQYVIISVKKTRTNNVIEHVTIRFSIGKTSTGGSLDPTFYPPQSRQWVALCDCDPRDPDPSFAEPWPAWPTTHDPVPDHGIWVDHDYSRIMMSSRLQPSLLCNNVQSGILDMVWYILMPIATVGYIYNTAYYVACRRG